MKKNDYDDIWEVDTKDEWLNGAYDENGDAVVCGSCGGEMKWDPGETIWYCPECGERMDRALYFEHIGAEPPGSGCVTDCSENYPLCKRYCDRYPIDPNDPMLL